MKSGYGMLTRSRNILKSNSNKFNKWCIFFTIIVAMYFSVVAYISIYNTLKYCFLLPFIFLLIFYLLNKFTKYADNVSSSACKQSENTSFVKFFLTVFFIIFAGQLLYWFAYYPGGFNLDALGQWDQVHGNMRLNDWHPVFTTGWYWLLTRIYDNFEFCIFVQLLMFSISVSCLLLRIYRLNVSKMLLIIIAMYIAINPAIGMNNVCLFKDVIFTIALIWMSIIVINIIESKGAWLQSFLHSFFVVINLVAITLIRHNGIFYTIPLMFCIVIIYRHKIKRILSIILSAIIILAIIQGPVYSSLSVEKHSNFTGEVVGIPMAIMANSYVNDYDNTPEEVKNLMDSIANRTDWQEKYIVGEWDSCKWDFGGIDLFHGEPLSKFIKMTLTTAISSPETTYQSLRENTRVVWQIFGYSEWDTWVYIEDNDYGIAANCNSICSSIVNYIHQFSLNFIGSFIYWNIGVANALFLVLILFVVARKECDKLVYCLPFVCYNLLTMLLLCGPSHRYFYFNSVLFLPIMVVMLKDSKRNISGDIKKNYVKQDL